MATQTKDKISLGDGNSFHIPPDNGCWVHPHCLDCPRERCILDEREPGRFSRLKVQQRDQDILRRREAGESIYSIATSLSMKFTTVAAIISKKRGGASCPTA